jgi:hypothetical protein
MNTNIDAGDLYIIKSGPLMSDLTVHNKKTALSRGCALLFFLRA